VEPRGGCGGELGRLGFNPNRRPFIGRRASAAGRLCHAPRGRPAGPHGGGRASWAARVATRPAGLFSFTFYFQQFSIIY
jgi:hypothetical protein